MPAELDLPWPQPAQGAHGMDVSVAQHLLKCSGRDPDINAPYGRKTQEALEDFQRSTPDLPADGKLGQRTWEKMTDGQTIRGSLVKEGSRGECARAAQIELLKHGELHEMDVTGIFDQSSVEATTSFQRRKQLDVDGKVGAQTWQVLITHINPELPWPQLQNGDQGPDVQAAQHLLKCSGRDVDVSGRFDGGTERAVKDFQTSVDLSDDGIIGGDTWTKMTDGVAIDGSLVLPGGRGECVRAAQTELVKQHELAEVNGMFDEKSVQATKHFQERMRIVIDGQVGPITWRALITHGLD